MPIPPRISTSDFTWSARCELSGAFSDVPLAVTSNGVPLVKLTMLLTCQPPTIAATTPPPFSQRLSGPKGSSVRFVICRLCVRSKGLSAVLRW